MKYFEQEQYRSEELDIATEMCLLSRMRKIIPKTKFLLRVTNSLTLKRTIADPKFYISGNMRRINQYVVKFQNRNGQAIEKRDHIGLIKLSGFGRISNDYGTNENQVETKDLVLLRAERYFP